MSTNASKKRSVACLKGYMDLVSEGLLKSDQKQTDVLASFDRLLEIIELELEQQKRFRWFRNKFYSEKNETGSKGIYLWGGVGTGKSMIMDIFFEQIKEERKLRIHFHTFMQEMHEKINLERKKGNTDPLASVAKKFAEKALVLCLDEFQITDIADAMIVGRLFSRLFDEGVFVVTTSNRKPDDLYKNGLNRELFVPFIKLFKERLEILRLDSFVDYRRKKLLGYSVFLFPINENKKREFEEIWDRLVSGKSTALEIEIKGRKFVLPSYHNGVGRGTFSGLCDKALGAADYLKLCSYIKVLFIEDIPLLDGKGSDSAKRFVILVDTLYENKIKIVCLAAVLPEKLYSKGHGSFEFSRTVSRLYEMQSAEWINNLA